MKLRAILIGAIMGFSCLHVQAQESEQKKENDLTVGLHLGSYHDRGNFNNFNPGAYVRYKDFVVGDYYNSIKNNSFYIGYMWDTKTPNLPLVDSVGVMIGGVTGYSKKVQIAGLTPVLIPSARIDLPHNFGLRLTYIPVTKMTKANVIHFSVEKDF